MYELVESSYAFIVGWKTVNWTALGLLKDSCADQGGKDDKKKKPLGESSDKIVEKHPGRWSLQPDGCRPRSWQRTRLYRERWGYSLVDAQDVCRRDAYKKYLKTSRIDDWHGTTLDDRT